MKKWVAEHRTNAMKVVAFDLSFYIFYCHIYIFTLKYINLTKYMAKGSGYKFVNLVTGLLGLTYHCTVPNFTLISLSSVCYFDIFLNILL